MANIVIDYLKNLPSTPQYNYTNIDNMFHEYKGFLLQWNNKMNLMSDGDLSKIDGRHFLDATMAAAYIQNPCGSMIDIGSGAGIPGIPLKILFPEIRLTSLDSNQKKCQFLAALKDHLKLNDVEVICDRAETVSRNTMKRESFDFAVTRAFAKPEPALEMVLPFVKVGGIALFWGSATDWASRSALDPILRQLGGRYKEYLDYGLPGDSAPKTRRITIVEKVDKTPSQYPRAVGIPQKRPLKV